MMSGSCYFPTTNTKTSESLRVVINIDNASVFTDQNGNKAYMLTTEQAKQIRRTITAQLRQLK